MVNPWLEPVGVFVGYAVEKAIVTISCVTFGVITCCNKNKS